MNLRSQEILLPFHWFETVNVLQLPNQIWAVLTIRIKSDPLMLDPRRKTLSQILIYLQLNVYVRKYNICICVYDMQKSLLFICLVHLRSQITAAVHWWRSYEWKSCVGFFSYTDCLASFLYVQSVSPVVPLLWAM